MVYSLTLQPLLGKRRRKRMPEEKINPGSAWRKFAVLLFVIPGREDLLVAWLPYRKRQESPPRILRGQVGILT